MVILIPRHGNMRAGKSGLNAVLDIFCLTVHQRFPLCVFIQWFAELGWGMVGGQGSRSRL
jgi:hypothetical protein